jgi:hypothetical protein
MPADQAAGLRRDRARSRPCIHAFLRSAEAVMRMAHALQQRGWRLVVVDTRVRLPRAGSPQSLFDWRRQLAAGAPSVLPLGAAEVWRAPGLRADADGLARVAAGRDGLLIDVGPSADEWSPMPGARNLVVVEVAAEVNDMAQAYAVLKALFVVPGASAACLLGPPAACRRVHEAVARFLGPACAQAVAAVAREDDAFAWLAVRMADEETGPSARE